MGQKQATVTVTKQVPNISQGDVATCFMGLFYKLAAVSRSEGILNMGRQHLLKLQTPCLAYSGHVYCSIL